MTNRVIFKELIKEEFSLTRLICGFGVCVLVLCFLLPFEGDIAVLAQHLVNFCGKSVLEAALTMEIAFVGFKYLMCCIFYVLVSLDYYVKDFKESWRRSMDDERNQED